MHANFLFVLACVPVSIHLIGPIKTVAFVISCLFFEQANAKC